MPHNEEILHGIGVSDEEIAQLYDEGLIRQETTLTGK